MPSCLRLVVFCSIFLLLACGGGGSSSDGDNTNASSIFGSSGRSASTGIRLLNGAIDASPIDLRSSLKTDSLQTARFGLATNFVGVSGDLQLISVAPSKHLTPTLFAQDLTLNKNERHTILLYGDNDSFGLSTMLLPDSRPTELGSNEAAIRIIHAVTHAAALDASTLTDNLVSAVPFGRASAYTIVASGSHSLTIKRSVDGRVIFSGTIELSGKRSYSFFICGELNYFVKTNLLED